MTFRRFLFVVGLIPGIALCLIALTCLLNPTGPRGYLLDIFSGPLLSIAVIATLLLALLRQRMAALLSLMAVLGLGLSLWSQFFPSAPPEVRTPAPVRLVFANLWVQNPTPERLLTWIDAQNPDLVAVIESGSKAQSSLIPTLEARYPYVARRFDTYIFSRYRLSRIRPRPIGYSLLTAKVHAPGGVFTLAVAHLTRPWPFADPKDQTAQLERLANDLGRIPETQHPERIVLTGDFNTTPSASGLKSLSRHLSLSPAPAITGTWPAQLPGPLRIGIDNVLAGPALSLHDRKVGPYYGSDHRPVRVDIYNAAE
ncbi:MAG: endonuclease/exonuclease/phosphatase family protein [Asticcacaulis sp.]